MQKPPFQLDPKIFFFCLHPGALPTKARQERHGFFLPDGANCLQCGRPETPEHVFVEYNMVLYFWDEPFTGPTKWEKWEFSGILGKFVLLLEKISRSAQMFETFKC